MESRLTNPQYIAQLLQSHGLHTNKRFGQNFLINQSLLELIVQTANIQPEDIVIEVGAGIGTLTQQLLQRAKHVIAFEIDTSLQPVLAQTLHDYHNIDLRFQDFMQADIEQVLSQQTAEWQKSRIAPGKETPSPPTNYHFVSNLPYNAGSHILDILLKSPHPPQSITVLLQKEVAQKITAQPPHATYLSNFFQTYGQAKLVQVIPPGNFFPPPAVDSALLHIQRDTDIWMAGWQDSETREQEINSSTHHPPPTTHQAAFSRFLHRGFANPRKMLNKAFTNEQLKQASISPNVRPENVTYQEWRQLYSVIQGD
jgi:16S rRNA (adenine1518-N6/adenine1519-N6)-dimethyltransferase